MDNTLGRQAFTCGCTGGRRARFWLPQGLAFMHELRISLFGKLKIEYSMGSDLAPETRRAQELLCYLLLNRDRLHEREKLATLMWSDRSTTRAKQYLRQALWQLQSTIQAAMLSAPLLLVDVERIGVNPAAPFWLDVAEFDQAFACVDRLPGNALTSGQVDLIQSVLPLYHGDLFEGCYEDWCNFERERYQNVYLALLDKLLVYCETHHEYEAGLAYGTKILHYDRARERTHCSLMRLYYQAGHRTAALQQYETCVAALADELNVGPAKSTTMLYQQICRDLLPLPGDDAPANGHSAPSNVDDALDQLVRIQSTLNELQMQVSALARLYGQSLVKQA